MRAGNGERQNRGFKIVFILLLFIKIKPMNKKGFTLIELLIVIAIIAIIAGTVFVALDPLKRFKEARDSRRWADVTAVLGAVKINQVDNKGAYISTIETLPVNLPYMIGTAGANIACSSCSSAVTQGTCKDLAELVTGGYIASVPMDPKNGTASVTNYYLTKNANGTITVGACFPETVGVKIEVAR